MPLTLLENPPIGIATILILVLVCCASKSFCCRTEILDYYHKGQKTRYSIAYLHGSFEGSAVNNGRR